MFFLDDIWHVVVRIVGALVLNPPGLPAWATRLLLVIRTVVVVVLFRRNIAPFMLAKVSRRIRARSISPRSIKGLYFRSSGRTWKVERIGWSFHPWGESRLSVKIEGLHVEISGARLPMRRRRTSFQDFSARGKMASFAAILDAATLSFERISTFNWILTKASSASITVARLFVRCLPSLTQNMDFDLDSVVVSFADLSGAHIMIRGVMLNTKIEFSQLEKEVEVINNRAKRKGSETNRDKPPSWNLLSNADRFWDRLWGQTQASASVDVTFNELAVCTRPLSLNPPRQSSHPGGGHPYPSFDAYSMTDEQLQSDTAIRVATPLHFVASLQFIPKLLAIHHQTVDCSLDIPRLDISANGVRLLMDLHKSKRDKNIGTGQVFTPPLNNESLGSSVTSPEIVSSTFPGSPTSPLLSAFSHITRHVRSGSVSSPAPPVQRVKDPTRETFISLFRSMQFRLPSISVTHDFVANLDGPGPAKYVAHLDGLCINLGLSDPRTHVLHRKWLGSSACSAVDGAALVVSCQFDLATLKHFSSGTDTTVRLLALHELNVEVLVSNWPQPWIPAPRLFSGNPNDAFLACEISITKIDFFERLDELFTNMAATLAPRSHRPPLPTVLTCVPRIELRAVCGSIHARAACADKDGADAKSILDVQSAGFNVDFSTSYRITTTTLRGQDQMPQQNSIQMNFTCHISMKPVFVRVRQTQIIWGRIAYMSQFHPEMFDDDPLLGLDTVELVAIGHTLGHFGYAESAVLDIYTTMMDIRCITEGISIDLWKLDCVRSLRTLLDAFRAPPTVVKNASHSNRLVNLYPGIFLHLAVGCLTGIVTAKDINPTCDLKLSRGLMLRTGCSLQYSCMHASLHSRVKSRLPTTHDRHQLGLSEDLAVQSMAFSNAEYESDDISALIQGGTWHMTCRTATSTPYTVDENHDVKYHTFSETLQEGAFISVPRTITNIRLRRRRLATSTSEVELEETCDVNTELPYLASRLDLLNAYSALLAMHTIQSLAPRSRPHPPKASSAFDLVTKFCVRVENAHVFCQFPLREQMFVRVISLHIEREPTGATKADCRSVVAWVPSVQARGKWEELSRIRDLSVTLNNRSDVKVLVAADGFRVIIPHRYVLSELILNIGLGIKALRHLRRTVGFGRYTAMGSPASESQKHLPTINVRIHSLTLEAADSLFEAKLGLIWRTGFQAQKVRVERELAFEAKLRAILASGDHEASDGAASQPGLHYHFTPKRTTSVADARNRLNMIHSNSWLSAISRQREEIARKEESILRQLRHATHKIGIHVPVPIIIQNPERVPPLFRAVVSDLVLTASRPNLPAGCEGILGELGNMPRSTEYSLLLPMRLELNLKATRINIRDYQLPLLNVPFKADGPSLEFMTNLVIAEEMGDTDSVEWFQCPVFQENTGIVGAKAFHVRVPKTIMPVKSYASPNVQFHTLEVTDFTWGVSYNPAVQEVMRVIETLSHPPRDSSPAIGFWDKIRLVFHWRITASFKGGARLHFKGSRDPYHVIGEGAGFDFCWDGNIGIKAGYPNEENELIQLTSESMIITIPNHKDVQDGTAIGNLSKPYSANKESSTAACNSRDDRKVCAKFTNGIRWGIGITLERTCGIECETCHGDDFSRACRFFTFIPHNQVVLHIANNDLNRHDRDSYAGFRSSFIHFSTSLTSPLTHEGHAKHNSFHLTPRTFAHFWSWWHLFDGALSLPIRQGRLFPDSRPPTKKFGRHLATLKYRISFSPLFITHVYKIDSGGAWSAGESRCVGVKAFIKDFQADMHQREEETSKPTIYGNGSKNIRHKPFSAVEVVIKGLDLRALFAIFSEPQKKSITLKEELPGTTNFWESLLPTPLSSSWIDVDDFVELDWSPSDQEPNLYLLEAASCPRFVYFKRTPKVVLAEEDNVSSQPKHKTKFGDEDSHLCLMGKEPTAQEVQLEFGALRLAELRARLADSARNSAEGEELPHHEYGRNSSPIDINNTARETSLTQMIALLERYTHHLSQLCLAASGTGERGYGSSEDLYDMPTDIKLPHVGEFVNVYQVHCPKISLTNATRNILQQYYLASRARRGFEYHMSTRAVKFIRDQAHPTQTLSHETHGDEKRQRTTAAGAQAAAAQVFRRILTGEERQQSDSTRRTEQQRSHSLSSTDPLFGWDKGVSERKAHFCLLLKPQIVLRSDNNVGSVLVLAADHVVLRNHGILDTVNAEDPVSGYVMQRNYADISSLQMFQPATGSCSDHLPLEVFVDFRCESRDFDRLVPQTHATLRYDKFNHLRLRNNATTVAVSSQDSDMDMVDHLLHETDLIVIQVPRFSVSADASAFASMSDVVTNLLLFRDPVHKARMTRLETMLFSYDFNDLASAAKVVADLQSRIRQLIRVEGKFVLDPTDLDDAGQHDLLASKAHILTLSQELNLIFDAIKLAQQKTDDRNQDKKSALRLQASSSEISWQMIDENRELLAKLAVRGIDYSWLSRQDSSSANRVDIRDLQVFDGSPNALLPEILAKHDDPPTHHMIRRGLFAEFQWSVLAPVGGISIYDCFEVELHPIRLALETQLGNKLLDYLIPGRRARREASRYETREAQEKLEERFAMEDAIRTPPQLTVHLPSDLAPSASTTPRLSQTRKGRPVPSRSFSNLKTAAADSRGTDYHAPGIPKSHSSTALVERRQSVESNNRKHAQSGDTASRRPEGDASEMRQRSAQKTFVHVKIPSVHVLLSVMKGRNFLVRDARLRTHDLEWRNRTWSFDELISQFIPSDPSWRGWVKVAWQQHVFSVGGVVKELITKTQWGRMGKNPEVESDHSSRSSRRTIGNSSEEGLLSLGASLEPSDSSILSMNPSRGRVLGPELSLAPPRGRSTSKPRRGGLFRRTGSRKPSADSTESPQASATNSPGRHRRNGSDFETSK